MSIHFVVADYDNPIHGKHLVDLLDEYSRDPMGGGKPLGTFAKDNLASTLKATPGAFSVIGFEGDVPVGIANCFQSISTFACRPLINIHDLVVTAEYRGQGLSQGLLMFVEQIARERRACKVTLEVLEDNKPGLAAYNKAGYVPYTFETANGNALFYQKSLVS